MLRLPSYILKSEKPGPVSNKTGRIEEARADVNQNTARSCWFSGGFATDCWFSGCSERHWWFPVLACTTR